MICQKCGTENVVSAKFCAKCGNSLTTQAPANTVTPQQENLEQVQSTTQPSELSTPPLQSFEQSQDLPVEPVQSFEQPQILNAEPLQYPDQSQNISTEPVQNLEQPQQAPAEPVQSPEHPQKVPTETVQTPEQPHVVSPQVPISPAHTPQDPQQQVGASSPIAQSFQQPPTNYPPQGGTPPHSGYPPHAAPGSAAGIVGTVFSNSLRFLLKKPVRLWGLSMLGTIVAILAILFSYLPIIWLPIILVLELGLTNIFLSGYRGQHIDSAQLFEGFTKGKFIRNACGMGWMALWIIIWGLIPFTFIFLLYITASAFGNILLVILLSLISIASIIIWDIKTYSYRYVPYIMIADPDISAMDALKKSMQQTSGYKLWLFLIDLIIVVSLIVLTIIFVFIARIPYIGIPLFIIYSIALVIFVPLFIGITHAAGYEEVTKNRTPQ